MNDLVSAKLVQIADQIQSTLVAKGPEAVNLMLAATRIDAIQNLIWGAVFIVGGIICIYVSFKSYKYCKEITFLTFMFALFGMSAIITGVLGFCDIFSWIGIWHPDIYIAHQLLNKVTN
jgi:hypothetical protein